MHVLEGQISFDFGEETSYMRPFESVEEGYKEFLEEYADSEDIYKAIEGLEFTEHNSKEIKAEIARRYHQTTDSAVKEVVANLYRYVFGMMAALEMMNDDLRENRKGEK